MESPPVKPTLADAANTMIPAYLALLQRGLSVSREPASSDDTEAYWVAEDADRRFIAEDPLALLGLVALYEIRGPEWLASDEQIDSFLAAFGVE
jgi:hypothetical protein